MTINLVWSGASDPEGQIVGYEISYKIGDSPTWIVLPFQNTPLGHGGVPFTVNQFMTHTFRIRTKDAAQNYSGYKTLVVPFEERILISNISFPAFTDANACALAVSDVQIWLDGEVEVGTRVFLDMALSNPINGTLTSIVDGMPFGSPRLWKISTSDNSLYSLKIAGDGTIEDVFECDYITRGLSSLPSTMEMWCLAVVSTDRPVYWVGLMQVGTNVYTDEDLVSYLTPGLYRIWSRRNGLERDNLVRIGEYGSVLSFMGRQQHCVLPVSTDDPSNPNPWLINNNFE